MNIETFFNNDVAKRFYFPGKIFIGPGIANKVVDLIAEYNSVAIVVDQFFSNSKLLAEIQQALSKKKCDIWILDGAPFTQDIVSFIEKIGLTPEAVLSIGGGSAADFAKSIILNELFGSLEGVGVGVRLGETKREGSIRPDYIAIPTTAGSGAESSRYYVTYDKVTRGKVYGKTWEIVADWIFLDPLFLGEIPAPTLVGCAFDAFVHLFETYIAKHEASLFGQMFALNGIPKIMNAIHLAIVERQRDDFVHAELLYGASLAGVAISNVRTGSIHEAAGALLELTTLSHAETLFVFFRTAVEQYLAEISSLEQALLSQVRMLPAFASFRTIQDIIYWWEMVFHKVHLDLKIKEAVRKLDPNINDVRNHIFNRIYSDKVWVEKESPTGLSEEDVWHLVDHSLNRFGFVQ